MRTRRLHLDHLISQILPIFHTFPQIFSSFSVYRRLIYLLNVDLIGKISSKFFARETKKNSSTSNDELMSNKQIPVAREIVSIF